MKKLAGHDFEDLLQVCLETVIHPSFADSLHLR